MLIEVLEYYAYETFMVVKFYRPYALETEYAWRNFDADSPLQSRYSRFAVPLSAGLNLPCKNFQSFFLKVQLNWLQNFSVVPNSGAFFPSIMATLSIQE